MVNLGNKMGRDWVTTEKAVIQKYLARDRSQGPNQIKTLDFQ